MEYNFRIVSVDDELNVHARDYHSKEQIAVPYILSALECLTFFKLRKEQECLDTLEHYPKYILNPSEYEMVLDNHHKKSSLLFNSSDDIAKRNMCEILKYSPLHDDDVDRYAYSDHVLPRIITKKDNTSSKDLIEYMPDREYPDSELNILIDTEALIKETKGMDLEQAIVKLLDASPIDEKHANKKTYRHNDFNIALFQECMDENDSKIYFENQMIPLFKDYEPMWYSSKNE